MDPITIIVGIVLLLIVTALLKSFYIWLFDIDEIKKNQKENNKILNEILEELKNKKS
jgi:hypothetical protein